jgi:hypothetical protein
MKFVLEGHMCWIFPVLIIIFTLSVWFHWFVPAKDTFERFENEKSDNQIDGDPLEKSTKSNENKNMRETPPKKEEKNQAKEETVKTEETEDEEMETFDNRNGSLNFGTSSLEPYYGPIRGYNCGEYSDYFFKSRKLPCIEYGHGCLSDWVYPPSSPSGYIFPTEMPLKGDNQLEPYFMEYHRGDSDWETPLNAHSSKKYIIEQ